MPLHYPDILQQSGPSHRFSYTDKDVILYALGVGFGADPLNEEELPFVYEGKLKVIPTAVTVLSKAPGSITENAAPMPPGLKFSQLNMALLLHGEQKVEIHRPLAASGTFTAQNRIIGAFDKGEGKGAVVVHQTVWTDDAGEIVATSTGTVFARGDGGFGGPSEGAPQPHPTPKRAPDLTLDFPTRPDQALLYRLNGDRNPLHADPAYALKSGFERPILHGQCTYGITCRAMLQAITDYDPTRILSHQVRFSSPVYPGETVTVDMWREDKSIAFEARVKARNITVIKNGLTVLR